MNIINVNIDFKNGTCEKTGISVVTGDYNSTKIVFEFNEEAVGTKMFELKNPSGNLVYVDEIINNEVILVGTEEVEGEEQIYSLFDEEGDYTFEVSLYGADSKLTSVCDYITARKEQVIIDEKVVEEYIPTFELLLNQITEKILEVDNLDIDSEKVGNTATITITKKDGTTKETTISDGVNGVDGRDGRDGIDGTNGSDGVGLDYDWNGTSLGIKREDESEYDYVNLKGEQGSQGETGTAGNGISNIQKTSTSGLIDTYTITYTNSNTDTFTVTNGVNGTNGTNGQDGYTPVRGVDYWTSSDIATIESYCDSLVLGALNSSY